MDIAKLQRVNQLARDLKSFGIADSMDAAYSQADGIMEGGSELDFLKDDTPTPEQQQHVVEQTHALKDDNSWETKFVHLSSLYREQEARIANMADIIMKMQHAMNDIICEIAEVREKQNAPAPRPQPAPVQQAAPAQQPVAQPTPQPTPQPTQQKQENNPRSGGFQSSDVAIDKIFYYGNK